MGRRMVGSLLFLGAAIVPIEIGGRLASAGRAGWGWFLLAGMMLAGVALNLWTEEIPTPACSRCRKPIPPGDLE